MFKMQTTYIQLADPGVQKTPVFWTSMNQLELVRYISIENATPAGAWVESDHSAVCTYTCAYKLKFINMFSVFEWSTERRNYFPKIDILLTALNASFRA